MPNDPWFVLGMIMFTIAVGLTVVAIIAQTVRIWRMKPIKLEFRITSAVLTAMVIGMYGWWVCLSVPFWI
jgi:hypothetical protein